MKIIYLHQYFLTPDMPGGHRSYEMARRLVRAGHEVHMVTSAQNAPAGSGRWHETVEEGIHVHWANVPYSNHMSFARRILAFVQFSALATLRAARLDGDVMFATSTPLTIAIPALIASAVRRIPFVFEVRDMWPDVPIAIGAVRNPVAIRLARALERFTYRRAAHVVALAPGMREDIIAKGIAPSHVSVIPNGCDVELFGAQSSAARDPRSAYEWLGNRKMALFAGTIGMVNGVDYLVRLAAEAARLDPEVRFVVVGGGREREHVRAMAESAGVLNRSFFMFDPVPASELAHWLRAADIAIALFTGPRIVWKDAVQNKFFDALAAGKPVAGNFDGWQSRVAADAGIGLILPPDDPATGAKKLVDALHDDAWLASVPARARTLAEGPFHRDHLAERLLGILSAVAHGNASPAAPPFEVVATSPALSSTVTG